ncbi:MAG: M20/M25/M40 family metallo-hydrolase [Ornithinimicrobium sp.]
MSADLAQAAANRVPQMLADLERLVTRETPSHDLEAVAQGAVALADLIEERLAQRPELIEVDGVTHVRLRLDPGEGEARFDHGGDDTRVLLLCHQDTVWPVGTLTRLPFSHSDGVVRGPGSFDMLTGLVMAIHAVALMRDNGLPSTGLTLLVTGDEEVGSAASRQLITDEVTNTARPPAVLVLEGSADGGAVKVARKGASRYRLTIRGRAAHAGLEPQAGVNAGVELAHQILAVQALADDDAGTSVVPTTLSAGRSSNTVPDTAHLDVDSRAWTEAEQGRVAEGMRSLTPHEPGAALELDGGINRPPLQRARSMGLYDELSRACEELGLSTPAAADVGGASDGNITAGLGAPTLDGLGAVGGGAHADHEHALVEFFSPRTAMVAGLMHRLLSQGPAA